MKRLKRFDKKGKLSTRYVGPYRILSHFRKVGYKLELPLDLAIELPVFYVSLLKKCISDPAIIVSLKGVEIQNDLSFKEVPFKILDHQI